MVSHNPHILIVNALLMRSNFCHVRKNVDKIILPIERSFPFLNFNKFFRTGLKDVTKILKKRPYSKVPGLTVYFRHMLPEDLSTVVPKITGCFLQNSNLATLMFNFC